jgi:glutathione synthase/RimK-type ligase-like ATP-grasp enzyme
VVSELRRIGIDFARFNTEDFPERVALSWSDRGNFKLCLPECSPLESCNILSAWYRRPDWIHERSVLDADRYQDKGVLTFVTYERRQFLEGAWANSPWKWVNHPDRVILAQNKLRQLKLASEIGFSVPETLVTNNAAEARAFCGGPSVAKSVAGIGVVRSGVPYSVFTQKVDLNQISDEAVASSPAIYQRLVPRVADLRVTVVGKDVFSSSIVMEDCSDTVDWRSVSEKDLRYDVHESPSEVAHLCQRMMKSLGLEFGAFDFIITPSDEYVFLELNPSGQWAWIEHATGQPITRAIVATLIEKDPTTMSVP